jgi:hypothetical protein
MTGPRRNRLIPAAALHPNLKKATISNSKATSTARSWAVPPVRTCQQRLAAYLALNGRECGNGGPAASAIPLDVSVIVIRYYSTHQGGRRGVVESSTG